MAQLALPHDAVLSCDDPPPRRRRQHLPVQPRGAAGAKWQDDHSSKFKAGSGPSSRHHPTTAEC
eukprot:2147890-Prymnesium_polylepis.1